jgi:hypothetical protein
MRRLARPGPARAVLTLSFGAGVAVAFGGLVTGGGTFPAASAAPPVAADRTLAPTTERGGEQRGAGGGGKADKSDRGDRPERAERADAAETASPSRSAPPDLGKLRAEYDRIREELFKARVRSQKVAEAVYPSKLDGRLRWKGGPEFVIRKARLLLDGAELWDSTDRAQTDDLILVSQRSVKPGPHALTVRLEIRPKTEAKGGTKTGAEKLGYTSEHTFAIVVAETGVTHLLLTGDEDGDPPEYEPELELEIEIDK